MKHTPEDEYLAGVMFTAVMIGLLCWLIATCAGCDAPQERDPKAEARAFAADLGMPVRGVSCVQADSDGDGYVSCTLVSTEGAPIAIDCGYSWVRGCRLRKQPTVQVQE
jgi:hypothetical protein